MGKKNSNLPYDFSKKSSFMNQGQSKNNSSFMKMNNQNTSKNNHKTMNMKRGKG